MAGRVAAGWLQVSAGVPFGVSPVVGLAVPSVAPPVAPSVVPSDFPAAAPSGVRLLAARAGARSGRGGRVGDALGVRGVGRGDVIFGGDFRSRRCRSISAHID